MKKMHREWSFCLDYRQRNAVTQQDTNPLPQIYTNLEALLGSLSGSLSESLPGSLSGSRYFSTLDLILGYWQMPLSMVAQNKTTFFTRQGLWKWKVLPFRFTFASTAFQLMKRICQCTHWRTFLLYLDDVIVIGAKFNTHIERWQKVLHTLQIAGLK